MPIASAPVSKLLLRNVRLFAGLPESQLELLASVAQRRSFAKGDKIFAGGEHAMSLHLIVTGKVQVVFADKHGAEVILDILNPGDYFGEMALIDELPRSATIVARESCEILILSKKDFLACLQGNFELAMALQRGLVKRLRGANSRIGSLALLDPPLVSPTVPVEGSEATGPTGSLIVFAQIWNDCDARSRSENFTAWART